ncbi:NUMOD4 domain-containing protein, partial [Bacteroidales bacterium]|nr:NUMOD4 domain-containing protein [Bacteroidales bacterium]
MKTMQRSEEKWNDLSFEGLHPEEHYRVSNYGRIKHFNKSINSWKVLSTTNTKKDKTGYEYFTWFKGDRGFPQKISKPVHRLVA